MRLSNLPPLNGIQSPVSDWLSKIVSTWNSHDAGASQWSAFSTNGPLNTGINIVSTAYTVTNQDQIILVNATSGAIAITLPPAASVLGTHYTIKDWKGNSATHNITISAASGQTIDGSSTFVMGTNYETVRLVGDGSNWATI
jgi:hypothetical protein